MATETENWDDDFEFGGQKTSRELDRDGAAPAASKEHRSRASHASHGDGEGENWDADFEDEHMSAHQPMSFPHAIPDESPPHSVVPNVQSSPKRPREEDYDSEEDDDAEFGAHGEEEDRTVTARSRRPLAQERPPMPELPHALLGLKIPNLPSAYSTDAPQPHPRSPTASVFSVPAPSVMSSTDSTAHMLARTVSGESRFDRSHSHVKSGHRLDTLPPSPPIHRERERRRLRKKSRPTPVSDSNAAGPSSEYPFAMESQDMHMQMDEGDVFTDPPAPPPTRARTASRSSSRPHTPNQTSQPSQSRRPRASSRSSSRPPSATPSRPRTPSHASRTRTPPNAVPIPLHRKASQAAIAVPQTPPSGVGSAGSPPGGGLLGRMSSVKRRWDAARRSKRSSTTPSEVGADAEYGDRRRSIDSRRSMDEEEVRRASIDSRKSIERSRRRQSVDPAMVAGQRKGHKRANKSMDWRIGMRKHKAPKDVVTSDDGEMDEDDNEQTPRPQSATSMDFEGLPPIPPVPAIQYDFDPSKYERRNESSSSLASSSSVSSPAARRASLCPSPTPHGRGNSPSPTPYSRGPSPSPLSPQDTSGKDKDKATTKLIKRKSMGFVQLRKSTRPLNGSVEDVADNSSDGGRPSSATGSLEGQEAHHAPGRMSNFVRRISFGSKGPAPGGVANLLNTPNKHKRTKSGGLLPPLEVHAPPLPSPLGTIDPSPQSTPRGPQPVKGAMGRAAGTSAANRAVGAGAIHSSLGRSSPFSSPYAERGSGFGSGRGEPSASSGKPGTQLIQTYSASGLASEAGSARPSPTMRRNSLGDLNMRRTTSGGGLRIPTRISQAQQGLRRDLGLVRDFAGSVSELRELRDTYNVLVSRVSGMLDEMRRDEPVAAPATATSSDAEPSSATSADSRGTPKSGRPSQENKRRSKDSRRDSSDRRRSKDATPSTPSKSKTPRSPFGRRSRSGTASSQNAPSLPAVAQSHTSGSAPTQPQPDTSMVATLQSSGGVGHDATPLGKFSSRFYSINNRYAMAWECADLLIELGGGAPPAIAGVAASPTSETHPRSAREASDHTISEAATSIAPDVPAPTRSGRDRGESEPGTRSHLEKSTSAPAQMNRTRAITLTDGESPMIGPGEGPVLPSSTSGGRASTVGRGGGDLTQRQLALLREMLTSPPTVQQRGPSNTSVLTTQSQHDSPLRMSSQLPSNESRSALLHDPSTHQHGRRDVHDPTVNREWTWESFAVEARPTPSTAAREVIGLASASSLTLPPEETYESNPEVRRKRASRIGGLGMAGLRDMLRALKRGAVDPNLAGESTSSLSTNSSKAAPTQPGILKRASRTATLNTAGLPTPRGTLTSATSGITVGRRRAKTSSGPPESVGSGRDTPYSRCETPYNQSELPGTGSRTHFEVPATPSRSGRDTYVHSNSSKISSKFGFHGNASSLGVSGSANNKSSPRRPSIASIFRIGKSDKGEGKEESQESLAKANKAVLKEGAKSPKGGKLRVKRRPKDKERPPLSGSGSGSASPALGSGAEEDRDGSGTRSASTSAHGSGHGPEGSSSTMDEDEDEDWDRMDVELDLPRADSRGSLGLGQPSVAVGLNSPHSSNERPYKASSGAETVRASQPADRGRSPYSQMSPRTMMRSSSGRSVSGPSAPGSSSSLFDRPSRLSNVEEDLARGDNEASRRGDAGKESPIDRRVPPLRIGSTTKTGSVRSMPAGPGSWTAGTFSPEPGASWKVEETVDPLQPLPMQPRLAMTPENIKPLLENAREIKLRLADCIEEVRELLGGKEFKELRKAASGDMVGLAV
ncbi:hypothetical protein BD626DRAFT_484447 [Schizophyllum amplum]|uniref:Uncharacterized protein n=1 Tax=Schizophyllum amplum TaxID=97359 RepID=A0A550CQB9_9AGAR|nr:hypothetical protein BD626DRAFT_484447 [Auriculariopsis ampla]